MDIQNYLQKTGISQIEFAKQLGVTQGMVSQWITGVRPVSIRHCFSIESATKGQVTRQDLRPDDYWLIWPELKRAKK